MKTHRVKNGMFHRDGEKTFYPVCGTNRGQAVETVSGGEEPTCGRCLALGSSENPSIASSPEIGFESEFQGKLIVHFGKSIDMIEPDGRSWCRMKIRTMNESFTTTDKTSVTCSRCLAKLETSQST